MRLLPVSSATLTGYHLDPLILNYPPRHAWTSATGWDLRNSYRNLANNAGYIAHRDFKHDTEAVALIGDSFVEASMLPPAERPGVQLEQALAGRPVYALGLPGSALLDYAERMRWAQQRYGIRDFVLLLERGDLRQSLCGSGNVHGPCLDPDTLVPRIETQPAPGRLKQWLRHSALAQYLFSQLKLTPQRLWKQALEQARPPSEAPAVKAAPPLAPASAQLTGQNAVAHEFFRRIASLDLRRLVIVLDTDRDAIYAGRPIGNPERQVLITQAPSLSVQWVDATPLLMQDYARQGLSFDVGPYDKHLNTLGVRLLMEAAARSLRNSPSAAHQGRDLY
ncbi:hypothetical protein [Paucibacter sp. XJ19-41]|uniref:hypothetical protein n=1 Tax=Paucibacter sp. XJ19-41 TaxID=2927824 RepID=UPI002349B972|nr:hypothetical protein [Paucibacter sp. XJ19-41]MDC6170511.1 hypothetical protein [Paucibacter sp. XJ19-41]